ncbi:MAG TPA: thiamine-phosphate kinase [Lysobacter sp.]|nr:thiamine-phosphate kinase [Lysobacter sp.]
MEFDLIERIRRRAPERADVVLGIGDDAAIVQVPPGRQLLIATDTLNAGVHFPEDTVASAVGWKALAVNLSDLAAMGAQPAWCTLSLSLPCSDAAWLDGFLDGFLELAALHRIALVGGDTTRGPLSICVTVHGLVAPGEALRRDAARIGDDVWVSGTLGDAAGALRLLPHSGGGCGLEALRPRLDRPTPRIATGLALAGIAHACIDISDGLLADLGHICSASGVAAEVRLAELPISAALRSAFDAGARATLQATGGDDYELCFTAPSSERAAIEQVARRTDTPLTRIGFVDAGSGVRATAADGQPWQPPSAGYQHFAGTPLL